MGCDNDRRRCTDEGDLQGKNDPFAERVHGIMTTDTPGGMTRLAMYSAIGLQSTQ